MYFSRADLSADFHEYSSLACLFAYLLLFYSAYVVAVVPSQNSLLSVTRSEYVIFETREQGIESTWRSYFHILLHASRNNNKIKIVRPARAAIPAPINPSHLCFKEESRSFRL